MVNKNVHTSLGIALTSLLAGLSGVSGCDWTTFDDYKNDAPVRVISAPGSFRVSGYGNVVETFHGQIVGDKAVSRVIVSAGADSPIAVERAWDGKALDEGTSIRCKKKKDCEKASGAGAELIPFETWARGTKLEQKGCVLAPGFPNAFVFCETNSGPNQNFPMGLDALKTATTTVRFSGAGLPTGHPLGVALLGVHAVSSRTKDALDGALYFQPDFPGTAVPPPHKVPLLDPRTGEPFSDDPAAGDLGFAVRAHANSAGELVIAVSQPSQNRVIVATFDDTLEVDPGITDRNKQLDAKFRTRACIKTPDTALKGFGKVLALGDVNDDGEPEIFVGIDPLDGSNDKQQRLYMYRGAELPAFDPDADVCPLWPDPVQIGCYDGIRGVECKDTAFGASIAVGDVDGDKLNDLIVGAPLADVQGEKEAGVVWIIPGTDDDALGGLDLEGMTNVYGSSFEANGHVGTSVAALRTKDRDEPVAGAPGSDRIYIFMCSKLETGFSATSLCLPK